ncbi:UNVERIFIED_CONTAM: hypothetical protein RMT77_010363 [Armadillidium vulgare]
MCSQKNFSITQGTSSSAIQNTDGWEILRHDKDHDEEDFRIESSPVITKENSSLIADETTPENEGSNLICPKSPSKKFEEYRLYPVKSRKKLLDILVPLNAVCQKEEQHNQSKLEEDGNFPKLPNRDVNSANNSQVCSHETEKVEEPKEGQSLMHEANVSRQPLRENVLQTPDMEKLTSFQSSAILASKKSENFTSSGVTSPMRMLLGSTISGISTLHYTSSFIKSEGSQSRSATQVSASMKESSSQDVILTSTPRDTTQTFDWEEISSVTDGMSDCSSLRPFRKNSKFTYSSDLPFSDFSQESCASNGSNVEKEVCLNSSQELSGSDKENIEPNGNKFEVNKIKNPSPLSSSVKAKPFFNEWRRMSSSQPVFPKRRRHRSFEDIFVSHSLSQPSTTGGRERFPPEKRIKLDPGLDCDENDHSMP